MQFSRASTSSGTLATIDSFLADDRLYSRPHLKSPSLDPIAHVSYTLKVLKCHPEIVLPQ